MKIYLENDRSEILNKEQRYNFLPKEKSAENINLSFDKSCLQKTINIANARQKSIDTHSMEDDLNKMVIVCRTK